MPPSSHRARMPAATLPLLYQIWVELGRIGPRFNSNLARWPDSSRSEPTLAASATNWRRSGPVHARSTGGRSPSRRAQSSWCPRGTAARRPGCVTAIRRDMSRHASHIHAHRYYNSMIRTNMKDELRNMYWPQRNSIGDYRNSCRRRRAMMSGDFNWHWNDSMMNPWWRKEMLQRKGCVH